MAQTVILAAGSTAATSTDVTLAAGVYGKIAGYTAGSQWGHDAKAFLMMDTGGADAIYGEFNEQKQVFDLVGPGVWRVVRPPQSKDLGFSSET